MNTLDFTIGPNGVYGDRGQNNGGQNGGNGDGGGNNNDDSFFRDARETWDSLGALDRLIKAKMRKLCIGLVLLVIAMVLINAYIHPWWNLWIFLFTTILYGTFALSIRLHLAAAASGVIYAWLASSQGDRRDWTQGSLQAIRTLWDPVLSTGLLVLLVIFGFLGTWPLAKNPTAALGLCCGSIMLVLLAYKYELGSGRTFGIIASLYALVYMGMLLWSTVFSESPEEVVDSAFNQPTVMSTAAALSQPRLVLRSEETTGPDSAWPDWQSDLVVRVGAHECTYWKGRDPYGENFDTQFLDASGKQHNYTGQPLVVMRAVRHKSTSGQAEPIIHDIMLKVDGKCPTEQ